MEQEIMNAYIQKQNKLIGELINKNLMLDARLEVVTAKLTQLEESKSKEDESSYK
jgi:mevalonate kinase